MADANWLERIGANVILIGGAAWAFVRYAIGLERKNTVRLNEDVDVLDKRLDDSETEVERLRTLLYAEREAHLLSRLRVIELERQIRSE